MSGFTARPQFFAPGDAERLKPVTLVVNFLGEKPDSLHVAGTAEYDPVTWIPKSQATYEASDLVAARARRAMSKPALLKLTIPNWLAVDRGFRAATDDRQGEMF